MHHIPTKFVPHLLTNNQKEDLVWPELLDQANVKNFLKSVITQDETCVYSYDIETKTQLL